MTERQLNLINKINDYVNGDKDDLYLDFDDYRELNGLLQKYTEIENIIVKFLDKNDINLEENSDYIGEFVYQNDEAYEDTVDSFVKILESCCP